MFDDLTVEAVPVIGQSMGGRTAMLLAAHHPERVSRLALVESGLGGRDAGDVEALAAWLRGWPPPFVDRDAFLTFFGGSRGRRGVGRWPRGAA